MILFYRDFFQNRAMIAESEAHFFEGGGTKAELDDVKDRAEKKGLCHVSLWLFVNCMWILLTCHIRLQLLNHLQGNCGCFKAI